MALFSIRSCHQWSNTVVSVWTLWPFGRLWTIIFLDNISRWWPGPCWHTEPLNLRNTNATTL